VLTVAGSVRARNARGGTAPEQVARQLAGVNETAVGLRGRLSRG
jgi:argininosuccinate lyase